MAVCLFRVTASLSGLPLFGRERRDKNALNSICGRPTPLRLEGRAPGGVGGGEQRQGGSCLSKEWRNFLAHAGRGTAGWASNGRLPWLVWLEKRWRQTGPALLKKNELLVGCIGEGGGGGSGALLAPGRHGVGRRDCWGGGLPWSPRGFALPGLHTLSVREAALLAVTSASRLAPPMAARSSESCLHVGVSCVVPSCQEKPEPGCGRAEWRAGTL